MIKGCFKTKILPAAVHLKTADGSAMFSLGKATLHLHIANFKFSHTFIICDKLPDTDILFGIDIQKRYFLSYSWDVDKHLFIQKESLFLTYTRNCEQQHNIAVVTSLLKIPLRHNGTIPVTIKGNMLKAPVGYFINNQHINRRLDPSIHLIDGIYNIKERSTLYILVANYTNKHVMFNKGQCIGHVEPSIDHMPQTAIKSLTIQKMLDKQVQSDTFTPPLHTSLVMWGNHSINYYRHLNHSLHRMKQVLEALISQKCKLTQVTQNMSCRGQIPLQWNTMTG